MKILSILVNIDIKHNIWWKEALEFIAFPSGSDVYKTGNWNGIDEKVLKEQYFKQISHL